MENKAAHPKTSLVENDTVARLVCACGDLPTRDILAFLGATRALRAVSGVVLRFGRVQKAARALEWCRRFGERFVCPEMDVLHCTDCDLVSLCSGAPGLTKLTVRQCGINSAAPIQMAHALQSLRLFLTRSVLLDDVSPLSQCRSLAHVVLHWSGPAPAEVGGLGALHACSKLKHLELKRIKRDGVAEGLRSLAQASSAAAWSLQTLSLQICELVNDDLQLFAGLRQLRDLDLSLNKSITSAALLAKCSELRELALNGCAMLDDVSGLMACSHLHTICLVGCKAFRDVTPLARCEALRSVNVARCSELRDVSELSNCLSLEVLNVRCSGVVSVPLREGLRIVWDADATTMGVVGVL